MQSSSQIADFQAATCVEKGGFCQIHTITLTWILESGLKKENALTFQSLLRRFRKQCQKSFSIPALMSTSTDLCQRQYMLKEFGKKLLLSQIILFQRKRSEQVKQQDTKVVSKLKRFKMLPHKELCISRTYALLLTLLECLIPSIFREGIMISKPILLQRKTLFFV